VMALLIEQELHALAVPEDAGGGGATALLALLAVEQIAEASAAAGLALGEHQAALAAVPADGPPAALADGGEEVQAENGTVRGRVAQVMAASDDVPLVVLGGAAGAGFAGSVAAGAYAIVARPARTGLRGLHTLTVALDGAAVAEHAGPEAADAARVHRRLAIAATATGTGRRAVADASAYLDERHQFGRPLSEFGALSRMLADAAAAVAAAAALWREAAARGNAATATQAARTATVAAVRAADTGVQLHGGYGYVSDHRAERQLRDAITLRALAGGRGDGPVAAPAGGRA